MDTATCQIPDINPFEVEAMAMLKKYKLATCSKAAEVIQLAKDNSTLEYSLSVNQEEARKLNITHPSCCMQMADRKQDDQNIGYGLSYFTVPK